MKKEYIRIKDITNSFGISKSHCWDLIAKGELKAFRPSPKVTLIKVSDMVNYIEKNEIKGGGN